MTRSKLLTVLAMAIAAAVVAAVSWLSAGDGSTPDTVEAQLPLLVLQCFNVTDGNDPKQQLTLYTNNFADDTFTVRRAFRFCEIATKNAQGDNSNPLLYLCYYITAGDDPNTSVNLYTNNFGSNYVTVRQATHICEPARKHTCAYSTTTTTCDYKGDLNQPTLQCFNLTGDDNPGRNTLVTLNTQNFGVDEVRVRYTTHMCESAYDDPPAPGYNVWQCFATTGGNDPNLGEDLYTDRFLYDAVKVQQATHMCESAYKSINGG